MSRALVVFHGHAAGILAQACAEGFRHCFVALDDGRYWVLFDGKAGVPELRVVAGSDFDLAGFYRDRGFMVVETETAHRPPRLPLMLGTCVGAAKRLLGLRAPFVLTPKQLLRRLARQ
jgi:hypothetical protein